MGTKERATNKRGFIYWRLFQLRLAAFIAAIVGLLIVETTSSDSIKYVTRSS